MGKWVVYNSDGSSVRATTKSLEYNGEYMGSCSLTISFESKSPINFEIGDYIDYRKERFYLNVLPTAKKQCSLNGSKDAFVYENVKFDSCIDELSRCDFLDIVERDSHEHWTALPTFSFYCGGVSDLASRIQANLNRAYGNGAWSVIVDSNYVGVWKDMSISIDKQTIWDALTLVEKNFKTNFIIRGRMILIGSAGTGIAHTFKYGIGNGLKSFERTIDDSQKVITRLRAYGNTTNIPTSYYKYLSMYVTCNNAILIEGAKFPYVICTDEWAQDELSYSRSIKSYINNENSSLSVRYIDNGEEKVTTLTIFRENGNIIWVFGYDDFYDWLKDNKNPKITVFGAMALNYNYLISRYTSSVNHDNYPNNMAVTRLMLPGFPTEKGEKDCSYIDYKYKGYKLVYDRDDVYIDSPNIEKLGIREGSVYIDGTDNETTDYDVYPSLEGMTSSELKQAGIIVNLKQNDNGCLDEIDSASTVGDNGDVDFNSSQAATMTVWIKDVGFNPFDYRTTETPTIYMKSGMCVGREFDITNIVKDVMEGYYLYRLTIARKSDNELNIVYPNSEFPIKGGDKFVLLHIKMPDIYYKTASQRLLKYALAYFADNDKTRFSYTPEIDNVWMARQHDEAQSDDESIYMNIKEGDKFMFDESEDMGISGNVFISNLRIKESEYSFIPEYEIQLVDKKSAGSVTRTLSKIASSIGLNGGSGDGLDIKQIKELIRTSGMIRFLSKENDDEAAGHIAFYKGIETFAQESNVAADGIVEYAEFKEE